MGPSVGGKVANHYGNISRSSSKLANKRLDKVFNKRSYTSG